MPSRRRSSVLTEEQQDFLERRLQNRQAPPKPVAGGSNMASKLAQAAKKLERNMIADNLNQQLYAREEEEVKNNSVFKASNVAPNLRAAKVALEHSITRDQVGHLLEGRPDPQDLIKQGIVQGPRRASRIQQMSKQLERNMTTDKVAHLLENRADVGDLQAKDILKDTRVAPSLQSSQRRLSQNLAKSNLYHALKYRPSVVELIEKGVYPMPNDYDDYGEYYPEYDDEGDEYEEEQCYDQEYVDGEEQYYEDGDEYYEDGQEEYYPEEQQQYYDQQATYQAEGYEQVEAGYQRRSKNFHLTRILLKFVASMGEAGELSVEQKGFLKDLIVDQDQTILAVAETFDAENDLHDFKDSLVRLASRR